MSQGDKNRLRGPQLESLEDRTTPSGGPWVTDPNQVDLSRVMIHFKTGLRVNPNPDFYAKGVDVVRTYDLTPGIWEATIDPSVDYAKTLDKLTTDPRVSRIDQNFRKFSLAIPNDTRYTELWGMNNTGQTGGRAGADIEAQRAWDVARGTGRTIVADIDTGVDYTHPDLVANLWKNPNETPGNGIDDDSNGFVDDIFGIDTVNGDTNPMDDHGHGTHVAGTIGAVANNSLGVAGVAWKTQIMSIKVLGPSGGSDIGIIRGLDYAVKMGAKVANMSLGGPGGSDGDAFDIAIQNAGKKGVIVVAAAGNGGADGVGDNNDTLPNFPSDYKADNIISVAATDHNDNLTGFSNYGLVSVDLAAPGGRILSTVPGGGYAVFDGTSMAAPHVAGALAVMMDFNPNLSYKDYVNLILGGVDKIPSLNGRLVTGGRLNLFNSLPPAPTISALVSASVSSSNGYLGDRVTFNATVARPNPSEPIPTGRVDLIESNSVIASANLDANGRASFTNFLLDKEGRRQFQIRYIATPNGRYNDGVSPTMLVTTIRRETTLASFVRMGETPASTIPFGQTITLLAHLDAPNLGTNLPTGSIEFYINSKLVGTRSVSLANNQLQAQINVDGLTLGNYTTYANYKGDSIYGVAVSPAVKFAVVKAATSVTITPQSDTAVVGESFAIRAQVEANKGARLQGRVQFRLNGSPIGSPLPVANDGTVLLRNTFLLSQIGKNRQLTATFTDTSGNYSGSTSPTVPLLVTNTRTTLSLLDQNGVPVMVSPVGDLVNLRALVSQIPGSAGTLGGRVDFFDGPNLIGSANVDPATGIATLSRSDLVAKQYLIRARYINTTGTSVVDSGLTEPSTLLVSRGGPTVEFTASPTSETTFGNDIPFSLLVKPENPSLPVPTGHVVVSFDAKEVKRVELDSNGAAKFTLTPEQYRVGANLITARYLGDGNYSPSLDASVKFDVIKAPTAGFLVLKDTLGQEILGPVEFRDPVELNVEVYNLDNMLSPRGLVQFIVETDGRARTLGQVALEPQGNGLSLGKIIVDQLPVGVHKIKAVVPHNDRFLGGETDQSTLEVEPGPSSVTLVSETRIRAKSQTTFVVAVDDGTGMPPVGIVTFLNEATGVVLGTSPVTTDTKGSFASITITNNFEAGPAQIRAKFESSKPGTVPAETLRDLVVFDKPTLFQVVASPASIRVNETVQLNVTLDTTALADFDPAQVVILLNGKEIAATPVSPFAPNSTGYQGVFSLTLGVVGTHKVSAFYKGSQFIDQAEAKGTDVVVRARVIANTQTGPVDVLDAAGKKASSVLVGENLKLVTEVRNLTTNLNPQGQVTFVAIKNNVETTLGTIETTAVGSNAARAELLVPAGITESGNFTVVARFTSTGDFVASNSPFTALKVVAGPAAIAFQGATTILANASTTLAVKVEDGTGRPSTGKVTFVHNATNEVIGSADVKNGVASLVVSSGFAAGALSIRAEYASDVFAGANSSAVQAFVAQADSKVTVNTAATAYRSTDVVTIQVVLETQANLVVGSIQLTDNGRLIATLTPTFNATTNRFEASHNATGLSIGSHRLVARYLGSQFTVAKDSPVRTIIVRR